MSPQNINQDKHQFFRGLLEGLIPLSKDPRLTGQLTLIKQTLDYGHGSSRELSQAIQRLYRLTDDGSMLAAIARLEWACEVAQNCNNDLSRAGGSGPNEPARISLGDLEDAPSSNHSQEAPTDPLQNAATAQKMRVYCRTGAIPREIANATGILKRSRSKAPIPKKGLKTPLSRIRERNDAAAMPQGPAHETGLSLDAFKPSVTEQRIINKLQSRGFKLPERFQASAEPDDLSSHQSRRIREIRGLRWLITEEGRIKKPIVHGFSLALLFISSLVGVAKLSANRPVASTEHPVTAESTGLAEKPLVVLDKFLAVKDWREMLPFIRHPKILEPVMERWYEQQPFAAWGRGEIERLVEGIYGPSDGVGHGNRWVSTATVSFGRAEPRNILIELTPEGYRVDWESAVQYQGMPFGDYIAQRPREERIFRLTVRPGDYHNFEFSDSAVWRSYQLVDQPTQTMIHGFIKHDSPQGLRISSFVPSMGHFQAILGLRFPDSSDSSKDVVEITSVLQKEWLVDYGKQERHFDLPPTKIP